MAAGVVGLAIPLIPEGERARGSGSFREPFSPPQTIFIRAIHKFRRVLNCFSAAIKEKIEVWSGDRFPCGDDLLDRIALASQNQGIAMQPWVSPTNDGDFPRWEIVQKTQVRAFCSLLFSSFHFRMLNLGSSQMLSSALSERLVHMLERQESDPRERKVDTINLIIRRCWERLREAQERVLNDRQDLWRNFEIPLKARIKRITALGKETHCRGKMPLLFEFKGGKEVIYKPRSVRPEWLLYADRLRPPQVVELLGSYLVLSRDTYGYVQRLTTTEAENTLRTTQDVMNYADRLLILNYFAQQLRISDLHSENIIIRRDDHDRLQPYIIDAEVYGAEDGSGLENFSSGPLYRIAAKNGSPLPACHRIFFSPELLRGHKALRDSLVNFGISSEAYVDMGINIEDRSCAVVTPHEQTESWIKATKKALEEASGRIVFVSTSEFRGRMNIKGVQRAIKQACEAGRIRFEEPAGLDAAIEEDIANYDVPIFTYNAQNGEVCYFTPTRPLVIGRLPGPHTDSIPRAAPAKG